MVRLEGFGNYSRLTISANFNSCMVRLEGIAIKNILSGKGLFQFLYGTIGSLEQILKKHSCSAISIPVWYDWKIDTVKHHFTFVVFQFLYGTIGSLAQ
tara:strand:+ start:1350 stop:1643 length:294 start_codon:yes stop_codon:yes gene_type:complete